MDFVDRPKLGAPNLLGVVININERNQYLIGTRSGRLPYRYERNQLAPCPNQILNVNEVPDNDVTIRVAVGNESATGKQGRIEYAESILGVFKVYRIYFRNHSLYVHDRLLE